MDKYKPFDASIKMINYLIVNNEKVLVNDTIIGMPIYKSNYKNLLLAMGHPGTIDESIKNTDLNFVKSWEVNYTHNKKVLFEVEVMDGKMKDFECQCEHCTGVKSIVINPSFN